MPALRPWMKLWLPFAALALLFVLPEVLCDHPPAQDLPGHLALAEIWSLHGRAGDPFAGMFSFASFPAPNTLYYVIVGALGWVMPVEWASKLVLAAALAGLPASIAYARRANGDDPLPALAGFAIALNFNYVAGFIGFAMALPLAMVMAGLARRQVEAPSWVHGVRLAGVGALCFLAHAQLFLFAFGAVGLTTLCGIRREPRWWKRPLLGLAPLAAPLALAVPWYLRVSGQKGGLGAKFHTVATNLHYLPIHTFDNLRSPWDMRTGELVVLGLVALLVLGARRLTLARSAFALCALVACVLYFVLPSSIRDEEVINGRMAAIALVYFAAAVPFRWESIPARVALGATVAATLAMGVVYADADVRFADEQAGLRATLEAAPRGATLVGVDLPKSKVYRIDVFRHVDAYQTVWNHGLVANTYATRPIQPILVTPAWRAAMRANTQDLVLSGKKRDDSGTLLAHAGHFWLYATGK